MGILKILIAVLLISSTAAGQIIGTGIPTEIKKTDKYLFYLHGHLVTVLGDNAVQQSYPEWGPYEYSNILDSLRLRQFLCNFNWLYNAP